jgi:hypothetical protein
LGVTWSFPHQPAEDVSIGICHIPMMVPVISAAGDDMKELMKYPPQFKIGFMSNNPPIYNLAPEARKAMQKVFEERRLGRGRINNRTS